MAGEGAEGSQDRARVSYLEPRCGLMLEHREGWSQGVRQQAWVLAGGEEQALGDPSFVLTGGKPEGEAH